MTFTTNTGDDVLSLASASGGGERPKQLAPSIPSYPVPGRSPEMNRRIASHEMGHAFVGRCLGTQLHSVSIIPGDGFEGRCRSTAYQCKFYEKPEDVTIEIVDLCERVERLMPELGANRIESAEFFQRATTLCIELVAGTQAERIFFPNEEPLSTTHDQIEAEAFAAIAVASPGAVPAFLEYCRAEAAGLISDHRQIAEAIAAGLVEYGELSGRQVDEIIARAVAGKALADACQRQSDWRRLVENAARFGASISGER
jgi:ATP-dependent Zn protease